MEEMPRGREQIASSRAHESSESRRETPETGAASGSMENSKEAGQEKMPRIEHILSNQERIEALSFIVPKISALVTSIQNNIGDDASAILPLLSGDGSNDEDLKALRKIFNDSEIETMLHKKESTLEELIQTFLNIKLLKEREEISGTLKTPENSDRLKDAFDSIDEVYKLLGIPVDDETAPAEFINKYGDLFVESLMRNDLVVHEVDGASERFIPHIGKIAVVIDDNANLGREATAAFKRGTIEGKSFKRVETNKGETGPLKLSDYPSIEKIQLGFSQLERIDGREKIVYRRLDIGVTELLARFSDCHDNIEDQNIDEIRPNDIEARNAFILSHIVGSEKSVENIAIPTVLRGNYTDDNINVEGLRFVVHCQISEGGFEKLKERVEEKMGPGALFFVDLAGEKDNFSKFFTLLQKHISKEPIGEGEKLAVERGWLKDYGIEEADILRHYPFVRVL